MVQVKWKVLCGDDSVEVEQWLFEKFDPLRHSPQIRRMTPVYIQITGLRGMGDGRSIVKGIVHIVDDHATAAAAMVAAGSKPLVSGQK